MLEHHSRPSGLPLILAALLEHQNLFRQIAQNPFLLADGIDIHPDVLRADALRERAWRVVKPQYLARAAKLMLSHKISGLLVTDAAKHRSTRCGL